MALVLRQMALVLRQMALVLRQMALVLREMALRMVRTYYLKKVVLYLWEKAFALVWDALTLR